MTEVEKESEVVQEGLSRPDKGRVRARLTQILVFVNGLILSITAFLTLNIFMTQMRVDYVDALSGSATSATSDMLRYIIRDMRVLAHLKTLDHGRYHLPEGVRIEQLLTDIDVYDRILIFEHNDGARWNVRDVYRNDTRIAQAGAEWSMPGEDYAPILLPMISATNRIAFRPLQGDGHSGFIAIKGLEDEGQIKTIHAFFVNVESYYDNHGGLDRDYVPQISLSAEGMLVPVFQRGHELMPGMGGTADIAQSSISTALSVANLNFTLDMRVREDFRILFLSKIPYLIMLFGMTLTMIGTLYVRNNHRQSLKLARAAFRLGEKNRSMNRQVQETERLYRVLQKSEQEYRNVINSVSDILFELNEAGGIVFLNQSWERITGIDKRLVQQEKLSEFIDPEHHEAVSLAIEEIGRGLRKKYEILTRLKTAEKEWRTVELQIHTADKRADDDATKMVGTITDIEDQTRANLALSEAEKKYQTIVENAAGGIYQVSIDGKLVSANPALARIMGYETPNQLIDGLQNTASVYLDRNDRARYERELLDVGFIRNLETRIRRADGQVIWVSENARAVKDNHGEVTYFEGSIEDITQRKNAEMALREAKIQSDLSSRAKSEFLANMSHELRTPLNAIIGFSEIIKSEAMGPLGQPAYSEYAGEIYGSGQKLLAIINEILDISKIEAGNRALNEGLVKLNDVAQSCLNMMVGKLDSRKLQMNNLLDDKLPNIIGEELAFKQILLNLLSNAVKFTPDGGQVSIGYDYPGDGADLTLSITDTGIGIDDADIPRALSAFGQLDNALDRSLSGTGLGLTLSKALIEMHGGRLELVSQKGVGTTVSLTIPARRVSQGKDGEGRSNVRVLNPNKRG